MITINIIKTYMDKSTAVWSGCSSNSVEEMALIRQSIGATYKTI